MNEPELPVNIPRNPEGNSENPQQKQSYLKTGVKHLTEILNPEGSNPYLWNHIFLAACVLAVGTDPLFFYIPIIHEDKKCLGNDKGLKILALLSRSFLDIFYITDIYYQIQNKLTMANSSRVAEITSTLWPYFISFDILGVLPLPQVVILVLLSKLRGSRSLDIWMFLNFLVFCQYVLRIVRTYLSIKELKRTARSPGPVFKGVLNFFLYVTASHVLGAFWYFFSIQRLTACWQMACRGHGSGCVSATFECNDINTSANRTILNDFCPINPPNATVFDFGIYLDAIQLGVLGPMDFPKKFTQCYWWGLRNLSSFGQNLKTSTFAWETWFAILVSVIGLLLFLYLIGNLQTYMQLAATKSEEERQSMKIKEQEIELICGDKVRARNIKIILLQHLQHANEQNKKVDFDQMFASFPKPIEDLKKMILEWTCRKFAVRGSKKHKMQMKGINANLWMEQNNIQEDMKPILLQHVCCRLEDNKDIDVKNMLSILPHVHKESLKKHFCLASLKRVPILQNMEVKVLEKFISFLKPVVYSENSYIIRKGEPLDLMLFITQGVVWSFVANDDNGSNYGFTSFKRLEKGDYYGEELVKWRTTLSDISFSSFPISSLNVRSHTKVEALVLTANDLMAFVSMYYGNKLSLQEWAIHTIQIAWRRHITEKAQRRAPLPSQYYYN